MPRLVQVFIVYAFDRSVGLGRDDEGFSRLLQRLDHPFIGSKGLIGNDRVRIKAREQGIGSVKGMCLSRREMEACGIAQGIAGGVNFGRQSAF